MGHFAGNARAQMLATVGISIAASLGFVAGADSARAAQKAAATEADPKQAAAAAAHKAYDGGLKSFANGKHQPAVDQLSTALRVGGLSSTEMAKALYTRGRAYKQLKKPGLAISDLTSALWLKNGLGAADRQGATAERADAYRMAGLGDGASVPDAVATEDPNPPAAAAAPQQTAQAPVWSAPAAAPASVPVPVASGGSEQRFVQADGVTRQSPDSEKAREAANARRLAAQSIEGNGLRTVAVQSLVSAPDSAPSAPSPAPASSFTVASNAAAEQPSATTSGPALSAMPTEATAEPSPSLSNVGKSIGGFFSNIFNGGSSAAQAPANDGAASVTTASTTPVAATSSWANSTSVAAGSAAPATRVAAVTPAKAAATAKPAKAKFSKGKYKIHIAAVRSRAEAEALAQQVAAKEGAALKDRVPVVDEAVIGSMGTFYRVRVGSYASADESRGICNKLRSGGFDCLVVTN